MNLKKKLLLCCVGGLLFVGLSLFLFDRFLVERYFSEWKVSYVAPLADKTYVFLPEFKKDIEVLKPKLKFLGSKNINDAGPYLNPRVQWDFSAADIDKLKTYESKFDKSIRFVIGEKPQAILRNFKGKFLELNSKEFSQINTEWLHKVRDFDYWDIDKNSPLGLFPRVTLTTPFPKFDFEFSKIHLIKAKEKNDKEYAEATLDVLHYGRLCLSTETLVGEMVFVATLGIAKMAVEARPNIAEKLGPWSKLLDETDRLKRVYWSMNQFSRPTIGANVETFKDVYKTQLPVMGICASTREATAVDWPVWAAFSDVMPSEYSEYRELIVGHPNGCRYTWIKDKTPAWTKLPDDPESLYSSGEAFSLYSIRDAKFLESAFNLLGRIIHFMPNTRRFVGTILITTATPSWVRGYESKLASENASPDKASENRIPAGQADSK